MRIRSAFKINSIFLAIFVIPAFALVILPPKANDPIFDAIGITKIIANDGKTYRGQGTIVDQSSCNVLVLTSAHNLAMDTDPSTDYVSNSMNERKTSFIYIVRGKKRTLEVLDIIDSNFSNGLQKSDAYNDWAVMIVKKHACNAKYPMIEVNNNVNSRLVAKHLGGIYNLSFNTSEKLKRNLNKVVNQVNVFKVSESYAPLGKYIFGLVNESFPDGNSGSPLLLFVNGEYQIIGLWKSNSQTSNRKFLFIAIHSEIRDALSLGRSKMVSSN